MKVRFYLLIVKVIVLIESHVIQRDLFGGLILWFDSDKELYFNILANILAVWVAYTIELLWFYYVFM